MTTATQTHDYASESAEQLAQRAAKLQGERDRLAQEADQARGELSDLRARLVTGEAKLGDVAVAQAKASALDGAIGDADEELARLRDLLSQAEQREARQAVVARIQALRGERAEAQEQFEEASRELDEACERLAAKMRSAALRFINCADEMRRAAAEADVSLAAEHYALNRPCVWPPRLRYGDELVLVLNRHEAYEERRASASAMR